MEINWITFSDNMFSNFKSISVATYLAYLYSFRSFFKRIMSLQHDERHSNFFFFFGHKDWVSLCRLQFSDKRPKYAIWLLRQISQTHHTKSKRKEWQIHWSVNVQFSLSSMHLMTYYFSKFLTTITEINLILLYNY